MCFGATTPSRTAVDVIGVGHSDRALNVEFLDEDRSAWFAAEVVEFIDHAPGTTIAVGSSRRRREPDGSWAAVNRRQELADSG
jgi:hypothetical protein